MSSLLVRTMVLVWTPSPVGTVFRSGPPAPAKSLRPCTVLGLLIRLAPPTRTQRRSWPVTAYPQSPTDLHRPSAAILEHSSGVTDRSVPGLGADPKPGWRGRPACWSHASEAERRSAAL